MTLPRTMTIHIPPIEADLPRVYVVAYLADASGRPITAATRANAQYVRTHLFACKDEAWGFYDDHSDEHAPLYISIHNEDGESLS